VSTEIEVANTGHHKAIVRSRNENYTKFKVRFEKGVEIIMHKYDSLRTEETRHNNYWKNNLKEITVKHI
jgi:hypothetical protein